MKEKNIRKYHGRLGMILSIFIIIQVGSGTLIAFITLIEQKPHIHNDYSGIEVQDKKNNDNNPNHEESLIEIIHHHGIPILQLLRVFLGTGLLLMVISGTTIYFMVRIRKKKLSEK